MERLCGRIVLVRLARLILGASPRVIIDAAMAFIVGLEIDRETRRFFGAAPMWLGKYHGLIDPHAYR
ncbi:MAG: hypothetical protein ACJZ9F_13210 [Rhodospirillaceae bacterium]